MLFPLETSIPATLFILIAPHHGFVLADQPFHHCRSNLFDDTGAPRRWLNLHKSNAANERLADGLHYGRYGPLEEHIRPRLSHSNSFGNDAEKDTAGCRALDRKYIVIGGKNVSNKRRRHRSLDVSDPRDGLGRARPSTKRSGDSPPRRKPCNGNGTLSANPQAASA